MFNHPVENPVAKSQRQRRYVLLGVRLVCFLLMLSVPLLYLYSQKVVPTGIAGWIPITAPLSLSIFLFASAVIIDLVTPDKKLATIFGVFVGLILGMIATFALTFLIDLLIRTWVGDDKTLIALQPYSTMLKTMLGVALCYLGITTVLQTQDDFRLVIPYVEFAKQIRGVKPTLLDTSAIIDARIVDIAATGLVQGTLLIPKFVLGELQMLADSSDRLKRARGRRGLDVVTRLQRLGTVGVNIDETPVAESSVDQKLVELARLLTARILTTDLGLARVAQIHGITVLNLHEIAHAFKPALIPGEEIMLRLVKSGEQPGQGVGYLEDGTMVVAEGGAAHIGDEVRVLVTSTMQTNAGRLIFTRVGDQQAPGSAGTPEEPLGGGVREARTGGGLASASEAADEAVLPEASPGQPETSRNDLDQPKRPPGPFPPKPAGRRPGSPRNPRR